MNKIFLFVLMISVFAADAQNSLNIVPMPAETIIGKGDFIISKKTTIVLNHGNRYKLENISNLLNQYLKEHYGFKLDVIYYGKSKKNTISLGINWLPKSDADSLIFNKYSLRVDSNISISATNTQSLFYGIQTFLQLLPVPKRKLNPKNFQLSIPQLSIKDYPRFDYRGMHLDVSRHFMPVSFIKKYIDYLAFYKFNTFHWHLTDDQGWRIEIKKYPKLTEAGAWRNGTIIGRYPGNGNDSVKTSGYYTQEQIKEVVQYAADRYINIIPEIEMPGHSSAAIAAYPQLSCFPGEDTQHPKDCTWAGTEKGKQVQQTWGVFEDVFCPSEYTFHFLEDVLDEVMALFPSQYIHIGGDECPKDAWKRSDFCQELIKKEGLKNEHGLQSYFIQRIEKYINSKGRKIIGWDEILEGGLAPNAAVMSWRGEEGGIEAAKQNHDVVMTPGTYCYFDHSQSTDEDSVTFGGYLPLEKVYSYEPVPATLNSEQAGHILGAQGNVWTEYMKTPGKVEYMIFPRMAALAEVLWTPKEKRNWKDFERRIPSIMKSYDQKGINYSKAFFTPETTISQSKDNDKLLVKVKTRQKNAKFYFGNKSKSSFALYSDSVFTSIAESGIYGIRMLGKMNPALKGEDWGIAQLSPFEYLYKSDIPIHFNKATGKKITLANQPAAAYPGDGAFTLVNGIQNKKGLARSSEFIGFNGMDCDATIDLNKTESISKVIVHSLQQKGSWIWHPLSVEVFTSVDGINFTPIGLTNDFDEKENGTGTMTVNFNSVNTRYIRVLSKNRSPIPDGEPGAGNPAWLFVDEVEVE